MRELLTKKFFKFVFGFLLIITATLLVVAGIQTMKSSSDPGQTTPPSKATTTSA